MKRTRALCIGDSNTYGYDPRSYFGGRYEKESRWPDLLAKISGWTVLNAGENGREVPVREASVERLLNMMSQAAPVDILLVMLGSNDLLQGADSEAVAERMECFLRRIPQKMERIVLISPPPMKKGEWVEDTELPDESVKLIKAYSRIAGKLGTQFIDTSEWETELTFDGVHFSEMGHRRFAEELWLRLREIEEME